MKKSTCYTLHKFKNMNIPAWHQFMSTSPYCCNNCHGPGQNFKQCHSKKFCKIWSGKHHSILHLEGTSKGQANTCTVKNIANPPVPAMSLKISMVLLDGNHFSCKDKETYLSTLYMAWNSLENYELCLCWKHPINSKSKLRDFLSNKTFPS